MARYSHLPLFLKTYELIKIVYKIVHEFRKEYKYTLGAELQQIGWQILDEIIATNSLPGIEKKEGILRISCFFDRFKIRFRMAYEMGLISQKRFACEQRRIEEIGSQIGGWNRWVSVCYNT